MFWEDFHIKHCCESWHKFLLWLNLIFRGLVACMHAYFNDSPISAIRFITLLAQLSTWTVWLDNWFKMLASLCKGPEYTVPFIILVECIGIGGGEPQRNYFCQGNAMAKNTYAKKLKTSWHTHPSWSASGLPSPQQSFWHQHPSWSAAGLPSLQQSSWHVQLNLLLSALLLSCQLEGLSADY